MDITSSRIERRGLMLVLSSPSGAGKTTISRLLLERDDEISLSVSVTTRPMRPGEVEGQDCHFGLNLGASGVVLGKGNIWGYLTEVADKEKQERKNRKR